MIALRAGIYSSIDQAPRVAVYSEGPLSVSQFFMKLRDNRCLSVTVVELLPAPNQSVPVQVLEP